MNLHEYQAKQLLSDYGIPIPPFGVARSIHQAEEVIKKLELHEGVVKIQVHAGGRGKAGGVKFGRTPAEILERVRELLGMKMVNHQTGPQGVVAHQVLISKPLEIKKEYYLGAIIDRSLAQPILIASAAGGMDIEEIAQTHPEKILRLPIGLSGTIKPYHLLRLSDFMGWEGSGAKIGMEIAALIARALIENDGSLLEINPLVLDAEGKLWALDAKLSIDDNALYRHPKLESYYDPTQYSPSEVAAKKHDLAYIALEGNIGCVVNGAGLAMATMDIIHYYGGKPANFLDVGGGASKEKVAEAFKMILTDPHVKVILVNIFGGIMNCATLAEGILHAMSACALSVPLIVRMEGTNVEEGKRLLEAAQLPIKTADSLEQAAEQAVAALGRG